MRASNVLDKTVDEKTVDIDDTIGDDASADTAGAYPVKHLRAAAGRLRRFRSALALSRRRTVEFFVRAWQVLRTEGPVGALRHIWQFLVSQSFSSLTRRIVFFNVAGLLAFVLGILYLTQFRAGLIDARVQALVVQGQTIATIIAYQGTDPDPIKIDLDQLFKSYNSTDHTEHKEDFEFSLPPDRVAPLLRRLIEPSKTLARIYDLDGALLLDSRNLRRGGQGYDPPMPAVDKPGILERPFITIRKWLARGDLPPYRDIGAENGKAYKEVTHALDGEKDNKGVYLNNRGQVVVLVAVPIQRADSPVRAALLLSTQGGDIDHAVEAERLAILKVFLIAASIISVLSMLLASTIAGPVRRLADSAERVRRRVKGRVEIPDFTKRRDEIGHLSGNLREMTGALYSRIEAIESFAADVAHELKNPLTSLRSAVETMPLAKTDESRNRLLSVVKDDVRRLDRLISDISDASRLDAELQRQEAAPVDLRKLLVAVAAMANEVKREDEVKVTLAFEGSPRIFKVLGHDSRLSQVMNNLIDNARSFSPPGGRVRVTCRRTGREILITVDDDGPGIRPDAIDKIFERFYTDRPQQNFGQNSGLGLSISKQIVEAHEGGHLSAQNRVAPREPGADPAIEDRILGARFSVRLPAS
jgi:two-component system, OmpR family, sensor histidine kinase ChvG